MGQAQVVKNDVNESDLKNERQPSIPFVFLKIQGSGRWCFALLLLLLLCYFGPLWSLFVCLCMYAHVCVFLYLFVCMFACVCSCIATPFSKVRLAAD